jgi:surfactin synthase thioesterase subunit
MGRTPIVCLPFAGAGASFYRTLPAAPPEVAIVALQPAGREERYAEGPYPDLGAAVRDLTAAAKPISEAGEPYIVFGHSFGALLAFEITRALSAGGWPPPARLVVSGSAAPGTPLGRWSSDLTDDAFVARVAEIAGYMHPALADADLREVVLPLLRSDVELHERYQPASNLPVTVPITAVRGSHDHMVSADDCAGWVRWSTAECTVVELPGGHMYLAEDPAPVVEMFAYLAGVSIAERR